jgi:hypothetical protein
LFSKGITMNRRELLASALAAVASAVVPTTLAAQPKVELDIDLRPLNNAMNAAHRMMRDGELDIVDVIMLKDLIESGKACTTHEIVRQYKTTVIVRPSAAFLAILQHPGRHITATLPAGWGVYGLDQPVRS